MSAKALASRRQFVKSSSLVIAGAALGGLGLGFAGIQIFDNVLRSTRSFTDDHGRTVTIPTPSHLSKVYFTGPIGQIMLFSLKPQIIGGTTLPFTDEELTMLPEGSAELPFMGSLSEDDTQFDFETIREQGIQLVLNVTGDDDSVEGLADPDAFQEELGLPVVCLRASFDTMGNAYRRLGDVVGEQQRAEEVATFVEGVYSDVRNAVGDIPVEQRVHLYYAEGADGLQTEEFSSAHANTFAIAGAYNVARTATTSGKGLSHVSIDQVRAWDPKVIVAWDEEIRRGSDEYIRSSEEWANIDAVKNNRVYTMPNVPFSWCDRPMGPNRCIGIQWLANLLYPNDYDIDILEAVREFYRVMWRIDVTDDQIEELLGNSYSG